MLEDDVRQFLADYLDILRDCIKTGFYRYFKLPDDVLNDMIPRSRAMIIHTFIIREAERRFEGFPGVHVLNVRGLFLVNFERLQIRFKKINRKLQSRNVLTRQTIAYAYQDTLPGISPAVNLIAGYLPDKFHTDIESLALVCPDGTQYRWFIPLDKNLEDSILLRDQIEYDGAGTRKLPTVKKGKKHEKIGEDI